MQNQVVIAGKANKDKVNPKKYKIEKHAESESDVTIELTGDGTYIVEKLSIEGLPTEMTDRTPIRWFNNFHIKKDGVPIKERFIVTIPDGGSSKLVICDSTGIPYYFKGQIINHTIELTDGDPAGGWAP